MIRWFIVSLLAVRTAFAAEPFECRWAQTPITVDGAGDDPAWKAAQVVTDFRLPWLREKDRPAKTTTKARLLWDREYLYFLAEMQDADLYADVREPDGTTWDNDVFELFFKPASDKPGYYEFQVNAAGTVMDLFLPRRGAGGYSRFKKDGTFHIDAKVKLQGTLNDWKDRDTGWTVEGRIPWTDFLRTGGRPAVGETWTFALCRYDYSVDFEGPELSTCAPLKSDPRPDFHRFEDYAPLKFVGPALAKPEPVASKVVGSPEPPPPYRAERLYPKLKIDYPVHIVRQPDSDRLVFIAEKWPYSPTSVCRTIDAPNASEVELLLKLDSVAYDLIFHPNFAENGYVYLGHNGSFPTTAGKVSRVSRYTMDRKPPYKLDPKSEVVVIEWPSDGHNGAALGFGNDGMLYVTSGDGTSDSDTNLAGQDLSHLLAKVLRIDVDRPDPGKMYSVPKDNPFVGRPGVRPETWAYGLRNPWRLTVDRVSGQIWVGNNGQDLWEQAYLIRKGDNYGWSVMEGSHPFYPTRKAGPTPFVKPTVEHHHSEARSLTGGIVYRGERFPELQGAYIYGDHSTGKIWGVKHDGEKIVWHRELADPRLRITGFGVDARGELLICDHRGENEGAFYTLQPTPREVAPSTFPRKLSDSGLFRSVKGHAMEPGLIPYSVNSPLWSDGAHKERWIALPPDGTIEYARTGAWNFPDGTVFVKSFALEAKEGDPATRRWVETRFLTRQRGEWFGYSYRWNDEQTDAVLVDAKGDDRIHETRTAQGTRSQSWHFPSRAECMVCHSRAANFVLGLSEGQLNRPCDDGSENQLHRLERFGVLRGNWADDAKALMREARKDWDAKTLEAWMTVQTKTRDQREPVPSTLLPANPDRLRKLVDPHDSKADLTLRVKSYLHTNCASCHVEAGGGNAQMELGLDTPLEKMRLLDVKPVHHTYGLPDARLVAPGHPERSVLLHRIGHREAGYMPPLATSVVDRAAVELLREWIRGLPPRRRGCETVTTDYRVDLDTFRGPMDLLLFLVKRNEVDILDIPIAKLTEQYVEYLNVLQLIDVERAGEFLVLAATLMEIKSKMLLPHDPEAVEEEDDPRLELVKQLVEYRKFKDVAALLESRAEEQSSRLVRQPPEEPARPGGPPPVRAVELWDLVSAFGRLVRESAALQPTPIVVDDTPQHIYEQRILSRLAREGAVAFADLFDPPRTRGRLVGIFLAMLELIRRGLVAAEQSEAFGGIALRRGNASHLEPGAQATG